MAIPFFNKTQNDATWSLKYLERPWAPDRESILEFLAAHASPKSDEDLDPPMLPDESWLTDMRSIRFAPGVFDRMMRVNETADQAYRQAHDVIADVRDLSLRSASSGLAKLHEAITRRRMSEVLEVLEEDLSETKFARPDRVRQIAMLLIRESPDRDAVKVGLLLLGNTGLDPADAADVVLVGSHGEFSRFAVPALQGKVDGWRQLAWAMAKRVEGPARAEAVMALAGAPEPEICQWLLEEGWRDNSYDDGAAFVCATTGGLETALRDGTISLEAAGGLLRSLSAAEIFHHPGLRQLPNGPDIVERYVRQMAASEQALWQFAIARSMHLFATSKYKNWEEDPAPGWTPEVRAHIAEVCAQILRLPGWEDMVHQALLNPDAEERGDAYEVAHLRHMDLWEHWWGLAQSDPGFEEWTRLASHVTAARVDSFLRLADERLNFELESDSRHIEIVAGALGRFPGKGTHFVYEALGHENRGAWDAIRVLDRWGSANWNAEIMSRMKILAREHPLPRYREPLRQLLDGSFRPPDPIPLDDEPELWET